MNQHVTLLGDSVFDNRSYTRGEPDVAEHLRDLLSPPWQVTLGAVDGATTTTLGSQLDSFRSDTSHVILSIGGNDALLNADLLNTPVRSTAEALQLFRDRIAIFETSYCRALEAVLALGKQTTTCTIYNGNLPEPDADRARVALAIFNDVILRSALAFEVPVIELRLVCTEPADFSNPIEPSGPGGRKIALAIARAIGTREGGRRISVSAG